MNNFDKISNILLVGGTHGNELTGIQLVKQSIKQKLEQQYTSFSLDYLIANSNAIKANKRYMDVDLNRSFRSTDLENMNLEGYESELAKEINSKYGPNGHSKTDFIIDLHTSTANMQTNIVITRIDSFHLKMAAYLKSVLPDVTVTSEADMMDDHHFLESIASKGVVIEVGPIPQGCIDYTCYKTTENAVKACLEFVELFNENKLPKLPDKLETLSYHAKLNFPCDQNGDICACVHPSLIDLAYPKINNGDPIFKTFDGQDILYQGTPTYLAFINEAAYYDKKIAMSLCRPANYSISKATLII